MELNRLSTFRSKRAFALEQYEHAIYLGLFGFIVAVGELKTPHVDVPESYGNGCGAGEEM